MNDLTIDEIRNMEGLSRQVHQTLEQIVEKMRTPIHEPVIREPIELEFMPDNISLD